MAMAPNLLDPINVFYYGLQTEIEQYDQLVNKPFKPQKQSIISSKRKFTLKF